MVLVRGVTQFEGLHITEWCETTQVELLAILMNIAAET
jgi:hypothetical protein